jgi:ribonucleoside-triphosphate reductase
LNPFEDSARYFPTPLQQTVYTDNYSRWREDLGRREAWVETVDRAHDFLRELSGNRLSPADYAFIRQSTLELRAMPSMRLLAMAGPAAQRNNIAIYNCTYLTIDSIAALTEIMLLSMNGCGVGYSVERRFVEQLPVVRPSGGPYQGVHYVDDSTEGWVEALRLGLTAWFAGESIDFNFGFVRPAGAILRTKGGRASGPEPLQQALAAIRDIIRRAEGRRLRPFEAHRIACLVAMASISGGVRRSALIALFDADNTEMLTCKAGFNWWESYPELAYANNSAVIGNDTPEEQLEGLLRQMDTNQTGEPGLFNRDGVNAMLPERRLPHPDMGLNPCGEIALRPMQTCNLSSAVCREADSLEVLLMKVEAATIIGTIQSMADNFVGLRPQWRRNQQDERLLGVDLNGQLDSPMAQLPEVQRILREHAVRVNAIYADYLGINRSAAVTTVKPSGNSSQMLDAASGLHARWSPYYIRHKRFNTHSPVRRLLEAHGVPMTPENGQVAETANTWVVPFPVKAPESAIFRNDRTAIEQLDYWLQVRTQYTEHQPSVTITYRPDEVEAIIGWVKEHRNYIAGLSFLPANDHAYEQAPYVEITQEEYETRAAAFPAIDFARLVEFEDADYTTGAQELACVAGVCDLQL